MAEAQKKPEKKPGEGLNGMFSAFGMQNPMGFIAQLIAAIGALMKGDFSGLAKLFDDDDAPTTTPGPTAGAAATTGAQTQQQAPAAPSPAIPVANPTSEARLSMQSGSAQDRQARVMSVMKDAAATAGISTDLMVGVWGKESSYGTDLKSGTGSKGDFQFTRIAMVETIAQKGDIMAGWLRSKGLDDDAKRVQDMHEKVKSFSPAGIRAYARSNAMAEIDQMSYDSEISTFAAAFHLRARADELKLNPNKPSDFGMIYAGYNIGAGHAKTILNGGRAEGWEVDANKGVAGGANQRADYDRAIQQNINSGMGQHFIKTLKTADQKVALNDAPGQRFSAADRTGKTLDTVGPLTGSFSKEPVTVVAAATPNKEPAIQYMVPFMS